MALFERNWPEAHARWRLRQASVSSLSPTLAAANYENARVLQARANRMSLQSLRPRQPDDDRPSALPERR
jgi:hypothetical protein